MFSLMQMDYSKCLIFAGIFVFQIIQQFKTPKHWQNQKAKANAIDFQSGAAKVGFRNEIKNDTEDSVKKSRYVCLGKVFDVIVTFTTVYSMIAKTFIENSSLSKHKAEH